MAEKEEPKEGEKNEEAKPKGKKKLIIIVAVVLLLAVGGGVFFMLGSSDPEHAEEVEEVRHYKTIKLDPFIVNLSEAKSFLKIAMLVEYDDTLLTKLTAGSKGGGKGHGGGGGGGGASPEGGFPPAMIEKEPKIRDKIISILSSKSPADVLSATGKLTLKDELIEGMNEILEFPEPVIVNIYFTEFIVQ